VKCRLCERAGAPEFCAYHQAAKEEVERAYPLWVRAYGAMEWKDYLDNIKHNTQTGEWAREIADLLGER